MTKFLAQRRKAVVAAVTAFMGPAAFYMHVGPITHLSSGTVWYACLVQLLIAAGVYVAPNEPPA